MKSVKRKNLYLILPDKVNFYKTGLCVSSNSTGHYFRSERGEVGQSLDLIAGDCFLFVFLFVLVYRKSV